MSRMYRASTTAALILCLVGSSLGGTLFASEAELSPSDVPSSQAVSPSSERPLFTLTDEPLTADAPAGATTTHAKQSIFTVTPVEWNAFAQRGGYRGRRPRGGGGSGSGNRDAAAAAIAVGAVASIVGAAILVYGNRPECTTNQRAGGCGYGTHVIGGAVLSAGVAGLVIGSLTW